MIAALLATCASALGAASAQAAPPVNVFPPTISGEAVENETLTGATGSWIGEDLTFTYQWQRSNGIGGYNDITGADASTYVLTADDVGETIRLRVTATNIDDEATSEDSEPTDTVAAAPEERSLDLFVSRRPVTYKRALIRAEGSTDSPLELWVYENLRGKSCPTTPSEQKPRTRRVVAGLPVQGAFRVQRSPRMKNPGRHTYCAYLGPDEDTANAASFETRKVRKPLLRAPLARRTVAVALRRHGFADRVIENLEQSCPRRSRSEFECRFSSAFPGYLLRGLGSVVLKRDVSYRFQASVHGRSFVLTDENEGGLPG